MEAPQRLVSSQQQGTLYATNVLQDDFDIRMLAKVLKELKRGLFFNNKWESLGLELGLYKGTLTSIEANHPRDVDACLRESLAKWLQRADGVDSLGRRPSWNVLSEALEEIDNKTAADYIRRQTITTSSCTYNRTTTQTHNWCITKGQDKRYTCSIVIGALLILLLAIGLSVKYNEKVIMYNKPQSIRIDKRNDTQTTKSKLPDHSPLFAIPSLENRIWIDGETGEDVVDLCISKLSESKIFPDDKQFMKRVAHVMSRYGKPPFPLKTDGGIWQVSIFAFRDTYDTKTHIRLPNKYIGLSRKFDVDWTKINRIYLAIPMYSAIAARMYLSNFAESIPPSYRVEEQADYWWNIYMMNHESKVVMNRTDFIETVKTLSEH